MHGAEKAAPPHPPQQRSVNLGAIPEAFGLDVCCERRMALANGQCGVAPLLPAGP